MCLVGSNKHICCKCEVFEGRLFWIPLNILYQIQGETLALDLGRARFLSIFYFTFTLVHPKLLERKMKLAHQGLNYILFNGHWYYWQPSEGYSLDKSSYWLRHERLDYDWASAMLFHGNSITEGEAGFLFHNDFEFLVRRVNPFV